MDLRAVEEAQAVEEDAGRRQPAHDTHSRLSVKRGIRPSVSSAEAASASPATKADGGGHQQRRQFLRHDAPAIQVPPHGHGTNEFQVTCRRCGQLEHFHRERRRLATADAQHATPRCEAMLLQRAEQGDEDAGAGSADRVTERAGAAVDIDLFGRQLEVVHGRHGDDGEGLVDLVGSTCAVVQPVFASSFCMAPTGAVGNSAGACAWVWWPTMRAIGARPSVSACEARISTSAAAPSEIDEALAGVTVPSLRKAGFRSESCRRSGERTFVLVDDDIALFPLTVTGVISQSKLPSLLAAFERVVRRIANSSCAARVKP